MKDEETLQRTREFWNGNPCDGQEGVADRTRFRYRKEPWVPPLLDRIAASHKDILEVGCGQGTDMIYACRHLPPGARYRAIDYSDGSVAAAKASIAEAAGALRVTPEVEAGNAEALAFDDNTFDAVLSNGVLHHTPDTRKAVDEILRVLKQGGTAYITLYRRYSPKLQAAYLVRRLGRWYDAVKGEGAALAWARSSGSNTILGTMIMECVGVPVLDSYTKREIREMFTAYEVESVYPIGMGFPYFGLNPYIDKGWNPLGAMWLVVARKPKRA